MATEHAMVKNAADEQQVKKAGRKENLKRKQELEDMKALLDTPLGRRVVWRYLSICGVYQSSFTGNSTTFFNEGRREVGLRLMADIMESNPDSYAKMVKESRQEEEKYHGG